MTDRPTYEALRERWELAQKHESAAYRVEPKRRRGRAAETAAALDAMFYATGNKVYADAFQAMRDDGFIEVSDGGTIKNAGKSWKYRSLHEKNAEATYISSMDELVRRNVSHRHAAAMVAVAYFIPGKTFNAVVTALEAAYQEFQRPREGVPESAERLSGRISAQKNSKLSALNFCLLRTGTRFQRSAPNADQSTRRRA
jgi:hypothetical protein